MAKLADALDLGSSGQPWGFKSLCSHQVNKKEKPSGFSFLFTMIFPYGNEIRFTNDIADAMIFCFCKMIDGNIISLRARASNI